MENEVMEIRSPKISRPNQVSKPENVSISARYSSNEKSGIDLKQKLIYFGIVAFLSGWISLCMANDNFLLDKAIMLSGLIICIMFLHSAQHSQLD